MVGKWHLTPSNQETAAGPVRPLAAGPRLRALLRLPRRRHEPVVSRPRLRQPPGRAADDARGGLPPDRGPRRQGDRVHRRRQAGRPGQAVLPALLLRRDARAAPRAEGVGRQVRGRSSTTAGTPTARRSSRGRRSWASCPPTPSSRVTIPTCRTGTRCRDDGAQAVRADDGGLRRLPQPHRPPHRAAARLPARASASSTTRSIMVISDNGASAEGGPTGTTNEAQFFNNAQEPLEESLARDRRDRRPEALQPLPVGLDLGRQHAVPALEARDLPRRRLRPVHRLTGRRASRPGARCARSTPTSSTWCRRCSTCSASSRRRRSAASRSRRSRASASRTRFDDADAAEPAPHPVLRDARPPRRSTTTAGGPSARGRGRRSPRPASGFGEPISADDALRARRHRLGALPRRRGLRREPRRRRGATATS